MQECGEGRAVSLVDAVDDASEECRSLLGDFSRREEVRSFGSSM